MNILEGILDLISLVASFASIYFAEKYWQEQVIIHNCGYYDPRTNDFKWNSSQQLDATQSPNQSPGSSSLPGNTK